MSFQASNDREHHFLDILNEDSNLLELSIPKGGP